MSEVIKDRGMKELGEILRLENNDPRRQVTFIGDTAIPNLPPLKRIGRPKTQWALTVLNDIWEGCALHERAQGTHNQCFDPRNENHMDIILESAREKEF